MQPLPQSRLETVRAKAAHALVSKAIDRKQMLQRVL